MILVDTSVWVGHFRQPDETLIALLTDDEGVLVHRHILGELFLGGLSQRPDNDRALRLLPMARLAGDDEVHALILKAGLAGTGIGYVDAHLLASARITPDTTLWTRDKRLAAVAERLAVGARLHP